MNLFALRQLMRRTRGALSLRWMVDGFNRRSKPEPGKAPVRNLMGFRDGTANLDGSDADAMTQARLGRVRRRRAGVDRRRVSYQVVRIIRMFVEFWDRTAARRAGGDHRPAQGVRRAARRSQGDRHPRLRGRSRRGPRRPLDAHIRLANPRTKATSDDLILRRGFSFSRGFDGAGRLDQGLAFVSFQRRLEQFLNTQARLTGEPLEEYIQPQGGGFFFALPGVRRGSYLGEGLLT